MQDIRAIKRVTLENTSIFTDSNKNLIRIANPAILLTTDKYIVTNEGEPWYTSGTHVKKGKEAILNENPDIIRITEKINNNCDESSNKNLPLRALFKGIISLNNVDPDSPYNCCLLYTSPSPRD